MDLVKIGFQINANGLKDANVEVDKLLTKVTRVSSKSINLQVKLDNSIQTVKKTLSDVEKIKNNLSALNIKVSMVGYSQVKANLEKLEALKKSVRDIQVRFTTIGNVNKIRDDFLKLKNKIITVKVVTSTAQLDNLKKKLDSIKNKTIKLNINLPKSSEVEKLDKALGKLTNKKVKIEVILTPDLTIIKEYANALDRIRGGRSTNNINLGGAGGSGGGRKSAGAFDQVLGIAKYALLSTAIYGVITGLKDLAISFVETADAVTNLTQRLGIYLPANIKVNKVMEQLGDIAKENRTALADSGKLFTQLLPPINRIKGGVAETIAVVDAFGKAMLIGGVNTQEAASATIQFGQAMASGKLAGDEFRSLAEASPRLLQAIADGAGIAAQKLKEMSAAGKLTSGLVSAALLDQFIQLEYEATKMGQTVSGAFNEGMVAYQLFINTFNEQTGFTTSMVESIRSVVKSLEGFGKGFLASLKDGDSTLNSFLGLLRTVWDIVGAVVGGFTDVVGWILKAGEKTGLWKATFDSTKLAIITIIDTLAKIPFVIVNIGTRLVELVLKPFEYFIALAQKGLDLAGFDSAAARLGQGLSNYRGFMGDIKGATGEVITGFNLLSLGVKETENSTGNVKDILDKLKQQNKDLVIQEQEKKAMTDSQYISEYAKLLLQKEGVDINAENLNLVKKELEERFKITQEQAKQLKIAGEAQAKKDEAEAKAKKASEEATKAAEQEQKRLQGIRDGYEEQIAYVQRLQMLLGQGEKADVARIAAEKDYVDAIGETSVARQVAEAKRQLSITEYNMSLDEEADILKEIQKLQDRGATNEQARALAQAKYVADELGMLALEYKLVNELENKKLLLTDQARTQGDINRFLAQGLSIEEAETEAAFARLSFMKNGLSLERQRFKEQTLFQQKLLAERQADSKALETLNQLSKESTLYVDAQTKGYAELGKNIAIAVKLAQNPNMKPSRAKELVEAESLNAYQKELATLKYKTYLNTLNESDAVKQLVERYADADSAQIGMLDRQQKLLAISKELSDEAEKQRKSPFGDFSNVDFNVFGDIGNPFKEALDGLNEFIVRSQEGANILASINEEIVQSKLKGLDVTDLEAEKTLVLAQQEKNRQLALDKGISTTLALTKSMFKEESKGYKVVSGLEKAYQASKIAFALWEKKDTIKTMAIKLAGYAKDMAMFIGGIATKITAQMGLNVVQAQGAVASAAQAPPPVGFASAAAMIALLAGIGIAVGGGGSSGSFAPTNEGIGTVFGDSEAKSASIANSIDLLSENSDLMLPLTSAMLRSLRNIESNIGGVTNLILRGETGEGFNIAEGFKQNGIGKGIGLAGQLAGGIGGAIGGGIAGAFGAGLLGAGMGSALGIGLGLATGGIGLLLGASLGKALGGLFGSKTTIKGQGLYGGSQALGDILSQGFNLQEYADVQTKKKAFGITTSTKNKTKYSKADEELANQFTLIFSGLYDSIFAATDILGADMSVVQTNLENAVIKIGKINLKGLSGEEIQEKLEAVFGAAADDLAKQAFAGLDDFQTVGEGYYETLIKVATGVEQARYFTDRLNVTSIEYTDILNKQGDVAAEIVRQSVLLNNSTKDIKGGFYDLVNSFDGTAEEITDLVLTLRDLQDQLFMTGKNADYLTSAMILGAGGLDKLSSGLDAYFEMLSPAEQAAELTRRLTNEFAIFGKELPADVKAFRNLVSSIDITTESGQKLYGQIIALAPEFNDLQDALESTNSEVNALVQSLRDLAEQARAARGETEQPRNLAYTRSQFEQASVLAMQGDIASAEKLPTLGKDLMDLSKTYSVTGSEYARDLALIQRAATVSADIQEQGLGTSISTTLTPSSGTTTTPVVATTNTATDSELKGMREDLNAGLFAIAKFVQNVDSRTERWDDGGRMMVGIQPENGDIPVPVAVVP